MFSIEAIMSTDLITLPPDATVAEARAVIKSEGIPDDLAAAYHDQPDDDQPYHGQPDHVESHDVEPHDGQPDNVEPDHGRVRIEKGSRRRD